MPSRRVMLLGSAAAVLVVAIVAVAVTALNDDDSSADAPQPMDLAVVGDSFAEQSRDAILQMGEEHGLETSVDAFGGSSLCAWMPRLGELRDAPPRLLVLSFAGNIFQTCVNPSCAEECQDQDPAVTAARYREHLDLVLALFESASTEVYVVSPPPIASPTLEPHAAAMREMYQAALADHPELHLIDSSTQLDPDGQGFQPTLPCSEADDCPPGEEEVTVRQDDLIHLTPAGARRYAQAIFDALER
jgi:lysophospholipase L1-like esterase